MRLPNAANAFVDEAKLTDYCLSSTHPRGKHKARRFAAFGFTEASAPVLKAALLEAVLTCEVQVGETDAHGQRFWLDFDLPSPQGQVKVRAAWIVRVGEDFPRLVSCYIV